MSLLLRRHKAKRSDINFHGLATHWADGASSNVSPMTITPPVGMRQGDLVYVFMFVGSPGPRIFSVSATGGQSWAAMTAHRVGALPEIYSTFCTFNGTWSANPQFSIDGSAITKSSLMLVFRPPTTTAVWTADQTSGVGTNGGGTTTTIVSSVTNTGRGISIAANMTSGTTSTFVSLSGAQWKKIGGNQYRNTGANAKGVTFACQSQGFSSPIGATGTVTFVWSGTETAFYNVVRSFTY
jgi:hypothetical protein